MSQRGGDVQSNLRISTDTIWSDLIPEGECDLILSLEPMESLRYLPWLSKGGWIVSNSTPFVNIPNYPPVEEITAELRKRHHPGLRRHSQGGGIASQLEHGSSWSVGCRHGDT